MYASLAAVTPEQTSNTKEAPGTELRNGGTVKLIQKIATSQGHHDGSDLKQAASPQKDNFLSKTPAQSNPKHQEVRRNVKRQAATASVSGALSVRNNRNNQHISQGEAFDSARVGRVNPAVSPDKPNHAELSVIK